MIVCFPIDSRDPYSVPLTPQASRRRFLAKLSGAFAGALILPGMLGGRSLKAAEGDVEKAFISEGVDPAELWLEGKQIVVAYKQEEELDELSQALDVVRETLPVSLKWRIAPEWVKVFPTLHFETSDRQWQVYEGWQGIEHFAEHYDQFYPPPHSNEDTSPFKEYAANYPGIVWTYPGTIDHHLLDRSSLHKFSEYEIRNLSVKEMEKLHSAHHEGLIAPGRKVTSKPPVGSLGVGQSSGNVTRGTRRRRPIFRRRR